MTQAAIPGNEHERLRALHGYDLLDRHADVVFDTIIRIAADVCGADISVIALIDKDRQYFFARNGMKPGQTPRAIAFCAHAILDPENIFEIPDATKDPRFNDNPLVTGETGVRFYAVQPLTTQQGLAIGGLCLFGKKPKVLNEIQRQTLKNLGHVIMALFESRKAASATATSLKKAEVVAEMANDAIDGQNKQLVVALENMSQGLCMFDDRQRLVVANKLYASMYGLSRDLLTPGTAFRQILEHRIANDIFCGEAPEEYIKERLDAVAEGVASTKIQLLSDGRVIAIAHRPLAGGGWVATHEDISELAKAETMNRRLARIVEDAINEVYVFDAETLKFLQVNASACRNLGYTMEELGELTPLDLKPEFTVEEFDAYISPLKKGEKTHIKFETIHRRKDGSTYNVDVTLQQIRSQNQQVFAAIIEDVTEKRQVERELKESQELFSKAFQANTVPFSISGPDGEIFDVNEAWLSALGYTREEIIGHSSLQLGIWADPAERVRFVEMLKRDGLVNNCETHYRTKTGELRDMIVSGEWVEVHGEHRMFNISLDVTESKAAERQLVEHRDSLQELVNEATADLKAKAEELECSLVKEKELNKLQREFVSMASHEFRNPLAIIDATAQRIKSRASNNRLTPQDAIERVEKIRSAVKRMTQLMESTLTAARMDEGKIEIRIGPCDISKVVREVCARQQEMSKAHVIACDLAGLPVTIQGDSGALEQVLTNLLSNAVKYAPEAPAIEVTARTQGDQVAISVRDHGIGIDAGELDRIGERFFRARTSTGIAGTGIGLNLAKTLAEMHGGTVDAESRGEGEGCTFTIRLPIAGPDRSEQADNKVA